MMFPGRARPEPPPAGKSLVIDLGDAPKLPLTLRVEMPCLSPEIRGNLCKSNVDTHTAAVLPGDPNRIYWVTVHVRGVVELTRYTGGIRKGFFQAGGESEQKGYNIFELNTNATATRYFLNAGTGSPYAVAVDYRRALKVPGGARLTLLGTDSDGIEQTNHRRLVVPEVDHGGPFDGQYVQVEIEKLEPVESVQLPDRSDRDERH